MTRMTLHSIPVSVDHSDISLCKHYLVFILLSARKRLKMYYLYGHSLSIHFSLRQAPAPYHKDSLLLLQNHPFSSLPRPVSTSTFPSLLLSNTTPSSSNIPCLALSGCVLRHIWMLNIIKIYTPEHISSCITESYL